MPGQKIVNLPWQAINERRNYPIQDKASRIDDNGYQLPTDLVVDLHVWFPASLGTRVVISSLSVSPSLISLTLATVDTDFIPIASVNVPLPLDKYRNYKLSPWEDGVSGWVAFGAGVDRNETAFYTFSVDTPANLQATELLPHVARSYSTGGVTGLGKPGRTELLEGIVQIVSSQTDQLYIKVKQVNIPAVGTVDALVFGLNDQVAGSDIFKKFIGACDVTPDSNNCLRTNIMGINEVVPDCDGVITLYFDEEEDTLLGRLMTVRQEAGSVLLDFSLGMSTMCNRAGDSVFQSDLAACEDPCEDLTSSGPFDGYSSRFSTSL